MKPEESTSEPLLRISRSPALRGTVSVPGDKFISHRALLFGALADGPMEIHGLGLGGDNASTASALRALGVPIVQAGTDVRVDGVGFAGLREAAAALDCGNSGTTMRMFCGLLAGRPFPSILTGDPSLSRRPMARVAAPLRLMGASIDGRQDDARPGDLLPPLRVRGGELQGIRYDLPVASAQLKSALILAGLQAKGQTIITEPGLSRDHSERMLRFMGAPIRVEPENSRQVLVDPSGWNGRLRAGAVSVPGDLSSAAFLLVAALMVPDSDVTVENVGLNPTRTGVLDALSAMGANLEITITGEAMGEPVGKVRARWTRKRLRGIKIDGDLALRSIDEIPALAAAAAVAKGTTDFRDLKELRVKESDRIACISRELGRAGVTVFAASDGLSVVGRRGLPLQGGRVQPDGDHRIAMAGAIMGLVGLEPTEVPNLDIGTSFPTFSQILQVLGAPVTG